MKAKNKVLAELNCYVEKELGQYDIGAIMEGFENDLSLDVIISEGYDGDHNHMLIYKDHPNCTQINLIFERNADSECILVKAY